MEAQGFSRHGFAVELCRSDSPLLFSIYWKFASLDCLVSSLRLLGLFSVRDGCLLYSVSFCDVWALCPELCLG